MIRAHAFVDGGYIRAEAAKRGCSWPNPHLIASNSFAIAFRSTGVSTNVLSRITYYDALPDEGEPSPDMARYWSTIERIDDCQLGFGALRGVGRKRRQKGVDTLLSVDMLVGAFERLFDVAILVAGDADFVPAVLEVKRRGVRVLVVGADGFAEDLIRAADRVIRLGSNGGPGFHELVFSQQT